MIRPSRRVGSCLLAKLGKITPAQGYRTGRYAHMMMRLSALFTIHTRRYAHLLREGVCRAVSFNVRELICRYSALAAGLDGSFVIAGVRPCFREAVKIVTVVAARPRGGSDVGSLASTAAWA